LIELGKDRFMNICGRISHCTLVEFVSSGCFSPRIGATGGFSPIDLWGCAYLSIKWSSRGLGAHLFGATQVSAALLLFPSPAGFNILRRGSSHRSVVARKKELRTHNLVAACKLQVVKAVNREPDLTFGSCALIPTG
jgi:hypothetical protein